MAAHPRDDRGLPEPSTKRRLTHCRFRVASELPSRVSDLAAARNNTSHCLSTSALVGGHVMKTIITAVSVPPAAYVTTLKCPLARQHLVQHGTERPDIAPLVRGPSLRLFRAHVGGGAEQYTDPGHQRG